MATERQTEEQQERSQQIELAGQFLDKVFYQQIIDGLSAQQHSQTKFETWLVASIAHFLEKEEEQGIIFSSIDLLGAALRRSTEPIITPKDKVQHGINQIAVHLLGGSASQVMDIRINNYRQRFLSGKLSSIHESILSEAEERLRENQLDLPLHRMVTEILDLEKTGEFDPMEIEELANLIRIGFTEIT